MIGIRRGGDSVRARAEAHALLDVGAAGASEESLGSVWGGKLELAVVDAT